MFCTRCGSAIADENTFCTNCGARNRPEPGNSPAKAPNTVKHARDGQRWGH
ncbi:MAG: zinc-ribbon domain-containing protein [Candidatus Acidiferrales bacterium]